MEKREIKFRFFDKEEKKMRSWGFPLGDGKPFTYFFSNSSRIVPMQYTGFKDKNGKEIYESDVLKEEGVVIFKDGTFKTKNYPLMNFFIYGGEDKLSKLEVIGNIYENPELLKSL